MKTQPRDGLIIIILSKHRLYAAIGAVVSLVAAVLSLWILGEYLSTHVDVSPFTVMAFTNTDERIGTMTGAIVNNPADSGLAGDTYYFKDPGSGDGISVWHHTTGDYDYTVRVENEELSSEAIAMEYNSSDRGELVVQSTYYSDVSGYNYTGEGKPMFVSLNIPRPYSWHGQNFNLRSYYQISWNVYGTALWLHVIFCAALLCVLLLSVTSFCVTVFRKSNAASITENSDPELLV